MYYSAVCPSPLGMLTLGSDGEHLIGLWLEGQKYFGGAVREVLEERDGLPVFDAARDWLARYFAGEKPMPSELPLCPIGGEFRQRVWSLLCQIPYGETTTYGALARALAAQMGRTARTIQTRRERPENFTLGELWAAAKVLKLTPIQAASIVLGRTLTSKEIKEFIVM